jgi:ribonuclease HI
MQKARQPSQGTHQKNLWEKPSPHMVKCNVDCALFNNNTITGLGICFRDSSGALLSGFSKYSYFCSTPPEAEALGLFGAINIAINCDMPFVIFESDCRLLVDAINSNSAPNNEFKVIISRCKDILSSRNNFIASYVKRQVNRVIHNIARTSLPHPSPHIFHDVPSTLYPLFFNEMN